ncbi:uncharacterized protein LOC127706868 [Mytilus californianus]|uniref:uncharacterized protein LOC127706868 n=1 Tax=Mytilus californianus TaxID=6549 RepID=UPI0022482D68|nr:uncharacterized protein LOC127706868 [Mytilus californianus]
MFFLYINACVSLLTILLTKSIAVQVADLTNQKCNDHILSTRPNKHVQLILARNENGYIPDIDGCYYAINLNHTGHEFQRIEVSVSLETLSDCQYKVEIYSGDPASNNKFETLDCSSNHLWKGHFPTTTLYLRYVSHTIIEFNNSIARYAKMMTNITYRLCTSCYQELPYLFTLKKCLMEYCGTEVCIADRDVEYVYKFPYWNNHEMCPPCRSITFSVKDSVQICFESFTNRSILDAGSCHVKVDIDYYPALVLKNSLMKKWCLPWNVKDKRVTFTFGEDSSWNCIHSQDCRDGSRWNCQTTPRCDVKIRIIPENRDSNLCPMASSNQREWSSWTKDFSDNDNNSSLSTKDTLVIIFTFVACVLVLICWYCKYRCTRKSQSQNGMENARRAFRNRGTTEQREHSTLISPNPRHDIQITNTANSSGVTGNLASSSQIEIHEPQQHFSIEGNSSRSAQPPPTLIKPSFSHEKPPPSYEDACKYYAN